MRFVAAATGSASEREVRVAQKQDMGGETYEGWVAGMVVESAQPKGAAAEGRERAAVRRGDGQRAEDVVTDRRTRPAVSEAPDAAQERAAVPIIDYLAKHATTRVGPRDRQVQVPVACGFCGPRADLGGSTPA
jgi:hypothetical protein